MKRILLFLMLSVTALYATESVLIDFSAITEDNTTVDYSAYLPEGSELDGTVSLNLANWSVRLNTSSNSLSRQMASNTKTVESKTNGQVLGIKVNFPTWSNNSYAEVLPPFEVPAYTTDGTDFAGLGIIKNVGDIQEIKINVYGNGYPHKIVLMIEDDNKQVSFIDFGSLGFHGWKTLIWQNPGYIENVGLRKLISKPIYPQGETFIRLLGFRILRDGNDIGGDTIIYIKDLFVTHDKSTINDETDIDDEAVWGINAERELAINATNMRRLADTQYLLNIEKSKMDVVITTTEPTE